MIVFSLVLSIAAMLFCWFPILSIPVCIAALILSIISINKTFFGKNTDTNNKKGLAIASISLSSIALIVSSVISFVLMYAYVFISSLSQ